MGSVQEKLLKFYPENKVLTYDEFVCDGIINFYHRNEIKVKKSFELLARPWTEISWVDIEHLDPEYNKYCAPGGAGVLSFLSPECYKYSFPSLLNEISKNNGGETILLSDNFMVDHLNLRNIIDHLDPNNESNKSWQLNRQWELDYYYSLDNALVRLVCEILNKIGSRLALDACDSYWRWN
jgi:hypothetical protein